MATQEWTETDPLTERQKVTRDLEATGFRDVTFFIDDTVKGKAYGVRAFDEHGAAREFSILSSDEISAMWHIRRMAAQMEAEARRRRAAIRP